MRTLAITHIPHQHDVVLAQGADLMYRVTYGAECCDFCLASEAMKSYLNCIKHALRCAGEIDESVS